MAINIRPLPQAACLVKRAQAGQKYHLSNKKALLGKKLLTMQKDYPLGQQEHSAR